MNSGALIDKAASACEPRRCVVPRAGLEPACGFPRWILSPLRLPFRHLGARLAASSVMIRHRGTAVRERPLRHNPSAVDDEESYSLSSSNHSRKLAEPPV